MMILEMGFILENIFVRWEKNQDINAPVSSNKTMFHHATITG